MSNGCTQLTNGNSKRIRAARTVPNGTDNHKLTEYYNKEDDKYSTPISMSPTNLEKTANLKIENGNPNHKLTEYFPVRRSVRKTSKCVMAEKMRDLERAIREQKEDGLEVCFTTLNI